jgi:peptidoglycan/xylan/chitin deacetylase (PgdA/CDA1 family)
LYVPDPIARLAGALNTYARVGFPAFENDNGVVLSIDDGPNPRTTPRVLDALDKHGLKAVFFLTGIQVENHPSLALEIQSRAHQIGSHGFNHVASHRMSSMELERQIAASADVIEYAVSSRPVFFRPPYGLFNPFHYHILRRQRHRLVLWNRVLRDWDPEVPIGSILDYVSSALRMGDIILLHDNEKTEHRIAGLIESIASTLDALDLSATVFRQPVQDL